MLCHVVNDDQMDWELHIPGVLGAYRRVPHASAGLFPFFLMNGRDPEPPIEDQLLALSAKVVLSPPSLRLPLQQLYEVHEAVIAESGRSQISNKRLRERTETPVPFEQGDRAWLHCPEVRVSTSAKLHRPLQGPVELSKSSARKVFASK